MPVREIVIVICILAIGYYLGKKGMLSGIVPGA